MINLGDKVKDRVTGYEGIVICKTEYLNGCDQCGVKCSILKDGMPQDAVYVDAAQLEVIEAKAVSSYKKEDNSPSGSQEIPRSSL